MGHDPSRSRRRDLTPRERRARLRRFSPTDAAFVLHLTGCERCRGHAARLLGPGAETAASPEDDIILHLTRGGYLLALADDEPQDDLPLVELQKFLHALSPEQAELVRHLLDCERCRRAVARALQPPPESTPREIPIVH